MNLLFKLCNELLGTFFFLSIILNTTKFTESNHLGPFYVSGGLLASVFFGGYISGGHYNPAVSVMFYSLEKLSLYELFGYVMSQCLGGLCASGWFLLLENYGEERLLS